MPSSPGRAFPAVRSAVEPTATIRPPLAPRRIERRRGLGADSVPNSACILWPSVSSAFTGRKVPGADMQRDLVERDALARASRSNSTGVKCSPAVGAATEPSGAANTVW